MVVSRATVSEYFEMIMIDWLKVHHSDRLYVMVAKYDGKSDGENNYIYTYQNN